MAIRGVVAAAVAAAVAIGLLSTGCGSSDEAKPKDSDSSAALPTSTSEPGCYGATKSEKATKVGDTDVLLLGKGPRGIVLAPEITQDFCAWIYRARALARKGYHIASFGWSDHQRRDLPAAVKALRSAGARKIVLMGASAGGGIVLNEAGKFTSVVGTIGVSPVDLWGGEPGLGAYQGPLLLIAAKHDPAVPPGTLEKFAKTHPGDEKTLVIKGNLHGIPMVGQTKKVRSAIHAFLKKHLN